MFSVSFKEEHSFPEEQQLKKSLTLNQHRNTKPQKLRERSYNCYHRKTKGD